MSCLMTSATRRSRSVPAAVLIASAAASSHEVLLVPMISVTLYTLMTVSFDHVRPAAGLLPPASHRLAGSRIPSGCRTPGNRQDQWFVAVCSAADTGSDILHPVESLSVRGWSGFDERG